MSQIQPQEQNAKEKFFYAHAIVDKNNDPLHDTSLSGLDEQGLGKVADVLNDAALENKDDNAPYRVVSLFWEDVVA